MTLGAVPTPEFTPGDYIAFTMVCLSVMAFAVREWRTVITARAKRAVDESAQRFMVNGLTAKLDDVVKELNDMEEKRQKHEIGCAKIQERTAASQQRTAEILTVHERSISQLQSQIKHVASGAANKIVEIGPDR